MIDSLHLHIEHFHCTCGHKWTHSQSWLASEAEGYLGGTPSLLEATLPFRSLAEETWNVSGCHQCVPLKLGKSWLQDRNRHLEELKAARLPKAALTEDLLA